jgi:hypothetical protein
MLNKSSLELSEVQVKVLDELELLSDAFVSTFNEIGKVVNSLSKEISRTLEGFVKERSRWRLYSSQCFDLSFIPFDSYKIEKKFSIESLGQYFYVSGQKILVQEMIVEDKKKQTDVITISHGFSYNSDEEPTKYFYFELEKNSPNGGVFTLNEFEEIATRIKAEIEIEQADFYLIEHPDIEKIEHFYIWIDIKYKDKISSFFQICKDELVEKFLSKIKD